MPNHTRTLQQIVMDMHQLKQRMLTDPEDLRNDIAKIAEAVRAIAEAALAERAPLNQKERP